MKACKCGSREFFAHQLCRLGVIVDESNCFLEDVGSDGPAIYDSETPYGPYTCRQCGTRHDRDQNAAQNILAEGPRLLQASA